MFPTLETVLEKLEEFDDNRNSITPGLKYVLFKKLENERKSADIAK